PAPPGPAGPPWCPRRGLPQGRDDATASPRGRRVGRSPAEVCPGRRRTATDGGGRRRPAAAGGGRRRTGADGSALSSVGERRGGGAAGDPPPPRRTRRPPPARLAPRSGDGRPVRPSAHGEDPAGERAPALGRGVGGVRRGRRPGPVAPGARRGRPVHACTSPDAGLHRGAGRGRPGGDAFGGGPAGA